MNLAFLQIMDESRPIAFLKRRALSEIEKGPKQRMRTRTLPRRSSPQVVSETSASARWKIRILRAVIGRVKQRVRGKPN